MFFDSIVYFLFLPLVVVLYWRLKHGAQNYFLLLASYFFYGWWDWRFLVLMGISTLVDFHLAKLIADTEDPVKRKRYLVISLVMNFGFLGVFKYFGFFVDSAISLAELFGASDLTLKIIEIALPPGISFYTFQAVAYIVDVYYKRLEPNRSLRNYALFICLFPHLIAGPIQRPDHLIPQVDKPRQRDWQRIFAGLMLIVTGLFRKRIVADNCALVADAAFSGQLGEPSLGTLALGTYAFAWQIYGDFSGYSDIARGSAQLMGFHFMVNFRQPYLSTRLAEFWRRWHISLSQWLRDYLYIPLGGNRHGEVKTYRNLFLTMLLGGLWHGANWTFVIWGALHGVFLGLERKIRGTASRPSASLLKGWPARIIIFHFVCLTWIFFRATSVTNAFELLSGLGTWGWPEHGLTAVKFLVLVITPMFIIDLVAERRDEEYPFEKLAPVWQVPIALAALVLVLLFGAGSSAAFIYFQF